MLPARTSPSEPSSRVHVPVPVAELELTQRAALPEPNALGQILLLVRLHHVPLGVLARLEASKDTVDLHDLAVTSFSDSITAHLALDGLEGGTNDLLHAATVPCAVSAVASSASVSVVVCTLGEEPRLSRTVRSILNQTHSELELVVVDNDPRSGRVGALLADVDDQRLVVVPEAMRGLSRARNAGLRAARGQIVAFTDDDAFAEPDWIAELVAPFESHPEVACVTGLVLPAELETPAQVWFEEFGAFDKGFEPTVWRSAAAPAAADELGARGEGGVLFPYSAGVYGSGNNMAFRAGWLRESGLFDRALGAGTRARGGEDLDAFLTVVLDDQVLLYQPRAVVRHSARSEMAALRSQMYGYGSGMSAVILKHFVQSPAAAAKILVRVPAGLRKLLDPTSDKNQGRSTHYPRDLARSELAGYAAGPLLYLRGRAAARRIDRDMPPASVGS